MTTTIAQMRTHLERIQSLAKLINVTAIERLQCGSVMTPELSGHVSAIEDASEMIENMGENAWLMLEPLEKELESVAESKGSQ